MTTIINGSSPSVTFSDGSTQTTAYPSTQTFGFENRLINGAMQIAQRATSATVTAGTAVPTASTGYPCVDRWFVYSTGANVTAAQVAGSGSNKNNLQITGAASVTAVGIGQRIEQSNSYDLAGKTCTLSVNISNSLLTTVTWTASYATTANTFGTIGTPTKTQIATGTFTVTSTLTQYSAQISVPAAATTGIEILFTVGAQTSGTWVVGNAQFEIGSLASTFDTRDIGRETILCQRYYQKIAPANSTATMINTGQVYTSTGIIYGWPLVVWMRSTPTLNYSGLSTWDASGTSQAITALTLDSGNGTVVRMLGTVASGLVAGNASGMHTSISGYISFSAEL